VKLELRARREPREHPRVVRRTVGDSSTAEAPERRRSHRHASHRATPDRTDEPSRRAPPIKEATWEWYIPLYFWTGGISAGAWLAAAVEDMAGEGDRDLIRAARYISATGIAASTVILIVDLGRPDRFLNMLRIVRARSTMSLGAWGLTAFGVWSGAAALLQALDDGLLGQRRIFTRLSRGHAGWLLHALGLPLALFVGGYTGLLLGTTSTPAWARRARLLGPLFITSAASTGLSAVSLALQAGAGTRKSAALRRLGRAESAALAAELALALINRRRAGALPSARTEPSAMRSTRVLTLTAGMALPLVAHLGASRFSERSAVSVAAGLLTLAGGLSLRFLTTIEGKRSARTPDDSWVHTGGQPRGDDTPRRARPVPYAPIGKERSGGPAVQKGEVEGVITIVQEDRIRVVDDSGRGYLFRVAKRRASASELEAWRDGRVPVRVRFRGTPDVNARAERIERVRSVALRNYS
jgi:formate-dependent nitrite reductase membrane component NrfD